MKNQKGVSLIALIITIIVIIILAAIVMQSSTGTIDDAGLAKFDQEFGDYSSQVTVTAANKRTEAVTDANGLILNDAQANYMVAKGKKASELVSGDGILGMSIPAGQVMSEEILTTLGYINGSYDNDYWKNRVVAYRIEKDTSVDGYVKDDHDFYGDSAGEEDHYVTSDGKTFTLPGFPQTQDDKSVRYYIAPNAYYTVIGGSSLTADAAKRIVEKPILNGTMTDNTTMKMFSQTTDGTTSGDGVVTP